MAAAHHTANLEYSELRDRKARLKRLHAESPGVAGKRAASCGLQVTLKGHREGPGRRLCCVLSAVEAEGLSFLKTPRTGHRRVNFTAYHFFVRKHLALGEVESLFCSATNSN